MIRIVVTFLIALQSLMPPGMCFCQFVLCETSPQTAKGSVPATPASLAVSATAPCCSCAARRSPSRAQAPSPEGEQVATSREALSEHSCPHPTPGEPWPGCPVVSAGPDARAAILPATEEALPDSIVLFIVPTDEATQCRADRHEPLVITPSAPLFLRHCALLI